ncbi:UDP-N-acetylglucosamine pyrophosphorylase [Clostridium baratii]|uniref:UDP-N-acetylglucosamine pyrophosphorylase n=1 Tax=Clostridium baratii TaxID=1561 RepID=UPI0030CF8E7B
MKLELNIIELGKLLKKIGNEYRLEMMAKIKLSGGWMTLLGEAIVEKIPQEGSKGNIITIRLTNGEELGSLINITGNKTGKFAIDISKGKYKEIRPGKLNIDTVKVNEDQCKLRIDDDIIFKIETPMNRIMDIIESL